MDADGQPAMGPGERVALPLGERRLVGIPLTRWLDAVAEALVALWLLLSLFLGERMPGGPANPLIVLALEMIGGVAHGFAAGVPLMEVPRSVRIPVLLAFGAFFTVPLALMAVSWGAILAMALLFVGAARRLAMAEPNKLAQEGIAVRVVTNAVMFLLSVVPVAVIMGQPAFATRGGNSNDDVIRALGIGLVVYFVLRSTAELFDWYATSYYERRTAAEDTPKVQKSRFGSPHGRKLKRRKAMRR